MAALTKFCFKIHIIYHRKLFAFLPKGVLQKPKTDGRCFPLDQFQLNLQ